MQVLASQLLFLANRNAGQAIPPLCWPVNCIKIGGHVALLSDPTVNCLYCGSVLYTIHVYMRIVKALNFYKNIHSSYSNKIYSKEIRKNFYSFIHFRSVPKI